MFFLKFVLGGGVEPAMTRMKILYTEPLYDPSIIKNLLCAFYTTHPL